MAIFEGYKKTSNTSSCGGLLVDTQDFLRETDDSLVPQIALALSGALSQIEESTNRALLTASYTAYWSGVKCGHCFNLPKPPFRSITSVSYIDEDGASIALSESETAGYRVIDSTMPQRIQITSDLDGIDGDRKSHLIVDFEAGYGESSSDFPSDLMYAILVLSASLYDGCELNDWAKSTIKRYSMRGIYF